MVRDSHEVDASYERFHAARTASKLYPKEFVVRPFLARYPQLGFLKPAPGARILGVAFGDRRNTSFLSEHGTSFAGIEITQGIVDHTLARMRDNGYEVDLRIGRNSATAFEENALDTILACAYCYRCDEGHIMQDDLAENAPVLKSGGWLVMSFACRASYIFDGVDVLPNSSFRIANNLCGDQAGYRLHDLPAVTGCSAIS